MIKSTLQQIRKYPSAIAGLLLILFLIGLSIYAVVAVPYEEAITQWRGGEDIWYDHPKKAAPIWTNWFKAEKLPETIKISSIDGDVEPEIRVVSEEMTEINYTFTFDYTADDFPNGIVLYFKNEVIEKKPFTSITWITPDGREIRIGDFTLNKNESVRIHQDDKLMRRIKSEFPQKGLFAVDPAAEYDELEVLKGTYTVLVSTLVFEDNLELDAELVVHGKVHGWFGTDHRRRDLTVALLWGTPVALAFGLLAAVGTSFTSLIIAAAGSWYGGWVDQLIQRITQVNLVIPLLPILIMVATFYSRSLGTMLGLVIIFNIFAGQILTQRAIFMQEREAHYIEAAKAYGASDARIIFRYLIPRVIPTLIPGLVILIPGYVFLEAALAVLGLGDPTLPTWGKMINDAYGEGALYNGQYYWVLEPSFMLMLTGFGFAMVGYALDRVFNPRLREI